MKTYRATRASYWQIGLMLAVMLIIFGYSARKAWGLWRGLSAKPSDPQLFSLDLNTTVPAFLLTLVALGCLGAGWYLVSELLSRVQLDDTGILLQAPGYRLYYRWDEIAALEVLSETDEDTTAALKLTLADSVPAQLASETQDEIAPYLNGVDRPMDKAGRQRQRQERRRQMARFQAKLTSPDGRSVPLWLRLVYPQVSRPNYLLLQPALAERSALIAEIEQHLIK